MKALFLTTTEPNYHADIVYHGMTALLGAKNVDEWPGKGTYHGQFWDDRYCPLQFDLPETKADVWKRLDRGYYDLVVADVRAPLGALERAHGRTPLGIAVLDGEEHNQIHKDYYALAAVYAKRDHERPHHDGVPRVIPLPMGWIPEEALPEGERPVPMSFVAAETHLRRRELFMELRRLALPGAHVALSRHPQAVLSYAEHRRLLTESQVAVSCRGAGLDVYRRWEIPAHGAAHVSLGPWMTVERDFVQGKEALHVGSPEGAVEAVRMLLANPGYREDVARAGREALLSRHTSRHRAERLLAALEESR